MAVGTEEKVSKPYDATSKDLIETDPAGWVSFLGCPVDSSAVSLVDADVSTVTAEADKVIRVELPSPWILHLEIQASGDPFLDRRLLRYNALLHHRHGLPVASVAVLLRSSADARSLSGAMDIRPPIGTGWTFRYDVLRVWERSPTEFLDGPVGLIPFAPLAKVRRADLPELVEKLDERIRSESNRALRFKLWTASYVLMGLRYRQALIESLLSGVLQMEESVTYQAIVRKGLQQGLQQGLLQEARKFLVLVAKPKLGSPGQSVATAIESIADVSRLEALASKIDTSSSWDELLKPE